MASSVRPPNSAHWGAFCAFGAVVVIRSRRPGALLAFALFALTVASPASAQTLKRHVPKAHSVGTSSPVSVSQTTTTLTPTNTVTQATTTTPYTGTIPPTPAPVVNAGKPVTTTTISVVGDNSIYSALGMAVWGERPDVIAPIGPESPLPIRRRRWPSTRPPSV